MTAGAAAGELRDRFLERAIAELLGHDDRLGGLEVDARVDGGVAHVAGWSPDRARRLLLRDCVGRLGGVHAVWDRVRVADQGPLRVVDLGCGGVKQYGEAVGVDLRAAPGVDVVADLRAALPFADASVDRVFAVHVLEHLIDFVPLLDEVHRVLRPDGVLHVMSPHWRSVNAVADPTHLRLLDVQTFKYLARPANGMRPWWPLHAGCDGPTVFADLTPVPPGGRLAPPDRLARFFD